MNTKILSQGLYVPVALWANEGFITVFGCIVLRKSGFTQAKL